MKKTKQLLLIVAFSLLCTKTYAQEFTELTPEFLEFDLTEAPFGNAFTRDFDISADFELAENSVILCIENGFLNNPGGSFTVSDSQETRISVSGDETILERLRGQLFHGSNLGNANGRDGIRTADGESWSFVSDLDPVFVEVGGSASGTGELFVELQGDPAPAGEPVRSNPGGFVWQSDGAFSEVTVLTTNTPNLANNFRFGVALAPVPEPASGLVLTCVVGSFLMRRKRS